MAIRIINPASTVEYVLKSDRESDNPTVFVLRPLTWEQFGEVTRASPLPPEAWQEINRIATLAEADGRDLTEEEQARMKVLAPDGIDATMQLNRQFSVALEAGLVEIRGLLDQQGSAMACTPKEFARCAHPEMLGELAGEILNLSHLSGDDRKN